MRKVPSLRVAGIYPLAVGVIGLVYFWSTGRPEGLVIAGMVALLGLVMMLFGGQSH